jgi:hypothetical protein
VTSEAQIFGIKIANSLSTSNYAIPANAQGLAAKRNIELILAKPDQTILSFERRTFCQNRNLRIIVLTSWRLRPEV